MENNNNQQAIQPVAPAPKKSNDNNLFNFSEAQLDEQIKKLQDSKKPITKKYNEQIREIDKQISYIRDLKKLMKKVKK